MTGRPADEIIGPLEPDIVGEFFVLRLLADNSLARTRDGATFSDILVAHSWREDPLSTVQFVDRCGQDFPDLSALRHIIDVKPNTEVGRFLWSTAVVNLMNYLGSNESTRARALEIYGELKALASAHSAEKEIRFEQAKAVVNLIVYLRSNESTLGRALGLYDELTALAAGHPTEAEIRMEPESAVGSTGAAWWFGRLGRPTSAS